MTRSASQMLLCSLSRQIAPAEAQVLTQPPSFLSENIRERSWGIEPRSRLRHLLLQDTRDISARHWVRAQKPHFSLSRTSSANTVCMQINPKSEQSYQPKSSHDAGENARHREQRGSYREHALRKARGLSEILQASHGTGRKIQFIISAFCQGAYGNMGNNGISACQSRIPKVHKGFCPYVLAKLLKNNLKGRLLENYTFILNVNTGHC